MVKFSPAHLVGTEQAYIQQVMESRALSGNGEFTKRCESILEGLHGGARVLLTTNCTHALEMMCLLLDLKPGDKVVVPSYTFVSSANAFAKFGVEPVFADVSWQHLCLDAQSVEARLSSDVKAVLTVNYGGQAGDVDALAALCHERGIALLEDNAQGIFATHRGQAMGTFGAMSALSFHATKNISCGEGGALVLNDPEMADRAEIIREKGTDRSRFLRGAIDKYTWTDLGSSYVISEILAAMLLAQLEAGQDIQTYRKQIWRRYSDELASWAEASNVEMPDPTGLPDHSAHVFYLLVPSQKEQSGLIGHLKNRGIQATFHYQPLHLSRMGVQYGGKAGDCPVSEQVASRIVRLPLSAAHSQDEITAVIEAVKEHKLCSP